MRKRAGIVLSMILMGMVCGYSMEVHIAPMLNIDEREDTAGRKSRVHDDLLRHLRRRETGLALTFRMVREDVQNAPQSLAEVTAVSRMNGSEYLLYGYVVTRDYTVEAEVRVFDYEKRRVIQIFYGIDDHDHYERMIADIAGKAVEYFNEAFALEIREERPVNMRIEIPVDMGYWTPAGADWVGLMLGTGIINTGITIVPSDRLFTWQGKNWYVSTGLHAAYRLGIGNPKAYEAYYHSIAVTIPVRLHVDLTEEHSIYAGAGFQYITDILSVEKKYEDPETEVYANAGLELTAGYSFALNERVTLQVSNTFAFQFAETTMVSYSPRIGIGIRVYRKETAKR